MISRHWKGVARPGQADAYIAHLRTETFPGLAAIPGFVRASILRRPVEAGTEFQIVTVWESQASIEAFAGARADVAVVPQFVQELMASYESRVAHYEIVEIFEPREASWPPPPGSFTRKPPGPSAPSTGPNPGRAAVDLDGSGG